jgi:hypothetical protein
MLLAKTVPANIILYILLILSNVKYENNKHPYSDSRYSLRGIGVTSNELF